LHQCCPSRAPTAIGVGRCVRYVNMGASSCGCQREVTNCTAAAERASVYTTRMLGDDLDTDTTVGAEHGARLPGAADAAEREEILRLFGALTSHPGSQLPSPTPEVTPPAATPKAGASAATSRLPNEGFGAACRKFLHLLAQKEVVGFRAFGAAVATLPPGSKPGGGAPLDEVGSGRRAPHGQSLPAFPAPSGCPSAQGEVLESHGVAAELTSDAWFQTVGAIDERECVAWIRNASGNIFNGWREGSRPRYCSNGSVCIGQWTNNMLDGYGIERWPDGTVFVGDFCEGRKHGRGRLAWVSGCFYEGEFERDAIHGEGVHVWSDGKGYSGQWHQSSAGPSGTVRWSDGRVYSGGIYCGRFQGHGTLRWPDGRCYSGQWVSGRQHGSGNVRMATVVAAATDAPGRESLWQDGAFAGWMTAWPPDATAGHEPGNGEWEPPSFISAGSAQAVAELIAESCSIGPCQAVGYAPLHGHEHLNANGTAL